MSNNNRPVVTFSTDDYLIPQSSAMPKYEFLYFFYYKAFRLLKMDVWSVRSVSRKKSFI